MLPNDDAVLANRVESQKYHIFLNVIRTSETRPRPDSDVRNETPSLIRTSETRLSVIRRLGIQAHVKRTKKCSLSDKQCRMVPYHIVSLPYNTSCGSTLSSHQNKTTIMAASESTAIVSYVHCTTRALATIIISGCYEKFYRLSSSSSFLLFSDMSVCSSNSSPMFQCIVMWLFSLNKKNNGA